MGEQMDGWMDGWVAGCRQGPPRPGWLVFNDFHISPCSEEEVGELFGAQKVPCLLYYTQVSHQRCSASSNIALMSKPSLEFQF